MAATAVTDGTRAFQVVRCSFRELVENMEITLIFDLADNTSLVME